MDTWISAHFLFLKGIFKSFGFEIFSPRRWRASSLTAQAQ